MMYNIIYADPPWQYDRKVGQGTAENHYNTMPLDDIKNLNVPSICADNAILFLWTTFPMILEGLETIKAWGFKYKTIGFVWVKRNKKADSWFMGLGNYTRSNAEICLIGVKGKMKRIDASIHQIIDTPIQAHSQKPAIVRDKIVSLMGDLPRIELFARDKVDGWHSWGNEVDNDIVLEAKNVKTF